MRASIQVQVYSGDPSWAPLTALLPPHGWPRKLSGHLFIHSTNLESVLLRELPKMEPRGHWGSETYARLSPYGNWPFDLSLSSQRHLEHLLNVPRYLSDTYPKITPDSLSLKDNTSFLVSEDSFVAFVFMSPWLSLPQNTPSGWPQSVPPNCRS